MKVVMQLENYEQLAVLTKAFKVLRDARTPVYLNNKDFFDDLIGDGEDTLSAVGKPCDNCGVIH